MNSHEVKTVSLRWWGDAVNAEGRHLCFTFYCPDDGLYRRIFTPLHALPGNTTDRLLQVLGIRSFHDGIQDDGTIVIPKDALLDQTCRLLIKESGGVDFLPADEEEAPAASNDC